METRSRIKISVLPWYLKTIINSDIVLIHY